MHVNVSFDYAVLRVVPRVEREEFVNAGVILYSQELRYLACCIGLDFERLRALAPDVDTEAIKQHLNAVVQVCLGAPEGGPMAKLSQRERFHWLTAPRSTMLQTSSIRTGICSREGMSHDALDQRLFEIASTVLVRGISSQRSIFRSSTEKPTS
ncbi:DUF3037 domain-containing protein [Terriglobus roseus]|uniref:DUF3037 domain-containing protein n=1 Tax=Terriglobus roseus TaxID=392734 RepID=A0A1G7IVV1_9BACT|nr:DUF3037 domain-containing protein [Terriglobus roseus]SDF16439.1 Protein of unknown function [Terriglobus roseus]